MEDVTQQNEDWFSEDTSTFGDRLAGAREAAGMTQAQLAKRLGVKLSTMQSWEEDLSEPRANRLTMMAGIIGVSFSWLLNGEGEGVEAPDMGQDLPDGVDELLLELRAIKARIYRETERMGIVEKRLRAAIKAGT
ncbi:helix-turn-helix domain-containing protein [Nereida ignava]|uniref:Transcriptional repressor DicA n=1 Tax=Nereida ignava TaxID=282199 RepID=A0A0U1NI75_9RHOB|nr:helix-turn-helix domain-containing protein [Nereida ignava]CRK74442.1 transcriptional repressor DicA [Nereida ignava]SFJ21392.1 Helix-turn-helix domain-containing protein [Nereida ignava DSM 16309]